jgi:hypothetical protein
MIVRNILVCVKVDSWGIDDADALVLSLEIS